MTKRISTDVLGIQVDCLVPEAAVRRIMAWAQQRKSRYVVFANAHVIVTASRDEEFASVISGADMIAADGASVAWLIRRTSGFDQKRVCGPDLMIALLSRCEQESLPVYLFGSSPLTLGLLVSRLLTLFPSLHIAGFESPPFRAASDAEDEASIARINASGAGLVFVGLGCPKQEQWMRAHRGAVNAAMLGVGAAFDYHAGTLLRAPAWMRVAGPEWLYRLSVEPRRLWRRYLVTNTLFVWGALCQIYRSKFPCSFV